jgi:ubiquinone/menaquinone biosynthesis C-methylase UbiE
VDLHRLYDDAAKDWSRDTPEVRDDLITWPFLVGKVRDFASNGIVVDIGCGTGNICRLASPHVKTAIGLDISQKMISEAERRSAETRNVLYVKADMRRLAGAIAASSADLVLSIFGYCCLESREELNLALRETAHILKPGGRLLLQIPHPCEPLFESKSQWARELDPLGNYFDNGATVRRRLRMANGKWITVGRHHFTLSCYFDEILSVNLAIRQVIEPQAPAQLIEKYPDLAPESARPSSLFIVAQKA